MCEKRPYSAVILAGGNSRRMGRDKAGILYRGVPMTGYLAQQLENFSDRLYSASERPDWIEESWQLVCDEVEDCGPKMGIYSALQRAKFEWLLVVSCDMPHFSQELADRMVSLISNATDAVVCRDETGRVHPLCAIYCKRILPLLQSQLQNEDYRMMHLLDGLRVQYCEISSDTAWNANTPEDWKRLSNQK